MLIPQHRLVRTLFLSLLTSAASPQSFDVASLTVVPYVPGAYHADLGTVRHGELTLTNATLCECLRYAFDINNDDQIAGPDWIKSRDTRFTITAKTQAETPLPDVRRMLQNLLEQRFQMVLHTEQRTFSYLALLQSKKGSKMHPTGIAPQLAQGMQVNGTIRSNDLTMAQLSVLLSRFIHQPVQDLTQLAGSYSMDLHWTPENQLNNDTADLTTSPSIYTAVQEQLGLSLEPRKGPLPVIVVDRANRQPSGN
jgi:uncharacterized protein (TIGR03435 family)